MNANSLLNGLGLEGPLTFGPGRKALPLRAEFKSELTVEHLIAAREANVVQNAQPIKALRNSHHQLARILAQKVSNEEAAIIVGYDPARISVLKSDPTFMNLLAYYEDMEEQKYMVARADMHNRLAGLGFDAIETLHQKLIDEPETFDNKTLLAVVEATTDRTGYGKSSTVNHDHTHSLSDAALARVKASALVERAEVAPADRSALLRLAARSTASELSEVPEAEWSEAPGDPVREEGEADAGGSVED